MNAESFGVLEKEIIHQQDPGEIVLGDILVQFVQHANATIPEMRILPNKAKSLLVPRRLGLHGRSEVDNLPASIRPKRAITPDSLIQLKLQEDNAGWGLTPGITMQDSSTIHGLNFAGRSVQTKSSEIEVISRLIDVHGRFDCLHTLRYRLGEPGVRIRATFINTGKNPLHLEYLTSFVLMGITPFAEDHAPGRLLLHRLRSWWSAEGRVDSVPFEHLHLERSWSGNGLFSERFGQVGTMPVRRWFPFAAIEDHKANVTWAAKLAWPGSWQFEITRRGDNVSLSGGLADREFGHWVKAVQPGETFTTPEAIVTVVQGDLDAACQALTKMDAESPVSTSPQSEATLPACFNEWCSSWGNPTSRHVLETARRLKGIGIKYIVIDDGWAIRPPEAAVQSNGDWIVDENKFPGGLKPTCDKLKEMGFIPGIWFEFEVVNPGSRAWEITAHQLQRDNKPLCVGSRRFWNFADPWVEEYLTDRVIRLLRENGFGYLKVDYNDNIGIGSDHVDSLGEGLRRHVEGVQRFFAKIRRELPEVVIENCSSGGHRLEPSMIALASLNSFSDAHETHAVPIIAANLHRVLSPAKCLVWAVLRAADTPARLHYSLAATFLGRACISGDILDLKESQMLILKRALAFLEKCQGVLRDGNTTFYGTPHGSYVDPVGWQVIVRAITGKVLVVAHGFNAPRDVYADICLPEGQWRIEEVFAEDCSSVTVGPDNILTLHLPPGSNGAAWLLVTDEPSL